MRWIGAVAGAALLLAGCVTKEQAKKMIEALDQTQASRPDVLPVMQNPTPPFVYPPSLYAERAQGDVTLRLFIDSTGHVRPESTQVVQSSGRPLFDSAAVQGAHLLAFTPAQRKGAAVPVAVLFPVYFRHPQGARMPEDSVLHKENGGVKSAGPAPTPVPTPAVPSSSPPTSSPPTSTP